MNKTRRFERRRALIFSIVVVVLVCITLLGFFALQRFKQADAAWRVEGQQAADLQGAIAEVHLRIGYGGLIHNFKNLILRRDLARYERRVENDVLLTRISIDRLDRLVRSPEEHAAVAHLRATFDEYANNYRIAVQLIKDGKSAAEIDAVIVVSDTAALAAIANLVNRADERLLAAGKSADTFNKEAVRLFFMEWMLTLGAIVGSVVLIGLLDRSLATNAALLRDKETLLKEVHHRVKNNLQVVGSLLRLEAGRSDEPVVKSVLNAMRDRIRAVGQLHESLYRSGAFASVDLGTYLGTIATQAFQNQMLLDGQVQLKVNMASVPVSMDQAFACGLLVNELISNGLKHGFPDGRSGEICVELQPANPENPDFSDMWRLRVSDSGVGLPPDFDGRREQSLGLVLVGDLSLQAGGHLVERRRQPREVVLTCDAQALLQVACGEALGHPARHPDGGQRFLWCSR